MVTLEDIRKENEKHKKEREEQKKKIDALWEEEYKRRGVWPIENKEPPKQTWDHPNTMENSTATLFYIVVMLVGSIFKGNWMIWIIATVVWAKFITRHNK